ncbi:translation initiation factor 2A [Pancytospora philotis]|nr:translation initiation factor 2A [Pancytospora philotis]
MPVVALTEKGLVVDVFGADPVVMKCWDYAVAGNRLVSIYNRRAKFVDLLCPRDTAELPVQDYVEMKISREGTRLVMVEYGNRITVFSDSREHARHANVSESAVSNKYYAIASEDTFTLYSFASDKPEYQARLSVRRIHCFDDYTLVVVKKAETHAVLLIKDGVARQVLELEQIFGTVAKASGDESRCLLQVEVEYAKSSYYADSKLYLLNVHDGSAAVDDAVTTNTDIDLVFQDEHATLIHYKSLVKVLSFGFVGEKFFVCFGNQPAHLHLYSKSGAFLKSYGKAIRNLAHFSRDLKRVICAGFGTLPGNIEVHADGARTCSFESLGSSLVEWLRDDTHFMVATTNYFKSDNKVVIYDYYGRVVNELQCENLVRADVYGLEEQPRMLSPPEAQNVVQPAGAYVPPRLLSQFASGSAPVVPKPPKPSKANKKPVAKAPSRTRETVEKELNASLALRERMMSGEDLALEEQNQVFSIKKLQEELEGFGN